MDGDRPRLELDLLAGPDPLVGPLAVHLDRRHRGRHLQQVADELGQRGPDRRLVEGAGRGGRDDLALRVVGGGRDAEPHGGVVRLLGEHQVAEQPGGALDPDDQDAGRHRVEGAGVADLAGAGEPADPGDHVVRGQPGRLVDDDQAGLSRHVVGTSRRARRVVVGVLVGRSRAASCTGPARRRTARPAGRPPPRRGPWPWPAPRRGAAPTRAGRPATKVRDGVMPHAELLGDLGPDQPLGRLQRRRGGGQRGLVALLAGCTGQDGVEDRRLLAVAGEPDVGDGDEPQPRVLDPPLEHLGDDDLDPVGDLADPWTDHVSHLSAESAVTRRIGRCRLKLTG